MIHIKWYIIMDTMAAEALEIESQSRYTRQAHSRYSVGCKLSSRWWYERVGIHAKHIRYDSRLHIHDVPDIHRKREDLLSPLLSVHDIEEMRRRQDYHIHNLTPRVPLHVAEDKDEVVELNVHYLVSIIEILALIWYMMYTWYEIDGNFIWHIRLCCEFQFVYRYVMDLSLCIGVYDWVLLICWI